MKQYISKYHFTDWFLSSDTYKNNFSYEGLHSLFDYLEQFEEDMGKEIEFDPVAICCEYSEYENLEEIKVGVRLIFQSTLKTLSDEDISISIFKLLKPIIDLEGVFIPGLEL